jgi:hypothetical protein
MGIWAGIFDNSVLVVFIQDFPAFLAVMPDHSADESISSPNGRAMVLFCLST